MHEVPECLNRRYRALDELIKELSSAISPRGSTTESPSETDTTGIRLMCDFWNILKENPDCDLPLEVQQRMNIMPKQGRVFRPQHITCYMAGKCGINSNDADGKQKNENEGKSPCCQSPAEPKQQSSCGTSKTVTPTPSDNMPLSKALCGLNQAATFEKQCTAKINKLMDTQKDLESQIQLLEDREKEGVQMLKQADCMWTCMENSYKAKVAESLDRQKTSAKQMKEVEASVTKWRKNKKDLEFQLVNVSKCHVEIKEKLNQKTNDMKIMDTEITDFKKRLLAVKNDTANSKMSLSNKRTACDAKVAKVMQDISRIQKQLADEGKRKSEKEKEGNGYVKEAREDLQHLCKVLLKKRLENEDLQAEKDALLEEIEILKQTVGQCKDKCKNKQTKINDEIKKIDTEIANYKVQCIRCHQCTDTLDVRKLCTDCPRCKEQRECLFEEDHCIPDPTMDCVCMSIKQKFLDNVFDNMYTVLERQARKGPGKAVAEAVLNCLKRSRNGKLDDGTRKIIQDFILTVVKKNLNLTIVGGAVKTRCEMDSETYKQLMLCLKQVQVTKPTKEDKSTPVKKDPCERWGGTSECNCPKGPKSCICTKKAPPPPKDPSPCPPPDKEDEDAAKLIACPHRESAACGPDCAMRAVPSAVGTDVAAWRPDPCKGKSCPFSKNMRAAQCMLGPESLSSLSRGRTTVPYVPGLSVLDNTSTCDCGKLSLQLCQCCEDRTSRPRHRIIEEVMGRYTDVSPIEKVVTVDEYNLTELTTIRRKEKKCDCTGWITTYSSENIIDRCCSCLINRELTNILKTPIKRNSKAPISICKNVKGHSIIGGEIQVLRPPISKNVSKNDKDLKMILCPKFFPSFKKSKQTVATSTSNILENSYLSLKHYSTQKEQCSLDSYDATYLGRKVCNTVRELMKDIVVPNMEIKNTSTPNSKWVTVESLYKEIEQLITSERPSKITLDEIEMSCQVLEVPKDMVYNNTDNKIRVCNNNKSNNKYIIKVPVQNEIIEIHKNKSTFNASKNNLIVDINGMSVKKRVPKRLDKPQFSKICDTTSKVKSVNSRNFNKNVRKCLRYSDKSKIQEDSAFNLKKSEKGNLIYSILNKAQTECLQCNENNIDNGLKKQKVEIKELNRDTKHLKADVMQHFDKGTCSKCPIKTIQRRVSHIGTVIPEYTKDLDIYIDKFNTNIEKKNEISQSIVVDTQEAYTVNSNKAMNKIDNKQDPGKIQIDIGNNHSQQFTELTKTLSGTLAIELDERIVEDMEKKLNEDPNLFLSLKETGTGYNLIYFDTKDKINEASTIQKVIIRKTSSGNRVFEIRKSIVRILKPDAVQEHDKAGLELNSPSRDFIKSSKTANIDSTFKDRIPSYIENATFLDTRSSKLMKNIDYHTELNQLYEQGCRTIGIKVKRGNAVTDKDNVTINRPSTRNIAIDCNNISLPDITFPEELPVLLQKTSSGTYLIDTSNNQTSNAVLKTTTSGYISLNVTDTSKKSTETSNMSNEQHADEYFKVKVISSHINMTELPAILKTSDSENFIIVLDKEFEKRYKQTIQDYIGDKTECYVDLTKSDSGSFVIQLYDTEHVSVENANALLVKTLSGSIKVYVKGTTFNCMHKLPTKQNSVSSAKAFGELLNNLPSSSREFHREHLRKSKLLGTKSSSDSNLYGNANLHDKDFFSKSAIELKKTASGKYAVVLNKESKKRFINNLKSYLTVNSQGLIPINRTESGEITIVLNNTCKEKGLYGSLKITPSGNIYVLVDENVIKDLVKKDVTHCESSRSVESTSSNIIETIKQPINKAVTTTCNARPDDSSCDASQCVCKELQWENTEWLYRPDKHDSIIFPLLLNKRDNWNDVKSNATNVVPQEICNSDTCADLFSVNSNNIPTDSLENKLGSTEQCYYVTDTVCPYNKDRYATVSNELFEIPEFCNRAQENITRQFQATAELHVTTRGRKMDDSLDFLPPQLPSFLSNIKYR